MKTLPTSFTARALATGTLALMLAACGFIDETSLNPDCQEAEESWGDKTQGLGESCSSGSYGSCAESFDNCIEGACAYGPEGRGSICMETCESDDDCSFSTCKDGVCQPAASCSSFCDGFCCCDYFNDPEDPTQCQQGTCYCG
jgi:hypothetical protein